MRQSQNGWFIKPFEGHNTAEFVFETKGRSTEAVAEKQAARAG
ncbi:hypothetical protein AB4Y89_00330 [Terriglobus sp. 2YAB30_2]